MPSVARSGIHFSNPAEFLPICGTAVGWQVYDSSSTVRDSTTTLFFTTMALLGLQDQTNWTANTYKTLLSISSGSGFVGAVIGCTAGGAETTTFEFTVDGVLSTITVTGLASGERAGLVPTDGIGVDFTTANDFFFGGAEALDADKATFGALQGGTLRPWRALAGIPLLKFNTSLLIRAKHSATITNSTATAYSAVMYRNLLAA